MLAFAPAILLPLIQEVVRPHVASAGLIGGWLAWAPDFVVGFCFPFSILVRPGAWTKQAAERLFFVWSVFTALALVLVELFSPFGPNVFDPADIAAWIGGVLLAGLVFQAVLRGHLTFESHPVEGQIPHA
jgi:hypothetical protein